jgi:general secretion pathway protein K
MTGGERRPGNRGIALLMVLWIIIILMVIVFSFSALSRTETYSALSFREMTENKNLAEAGLERGIMEIIYRKQKPPDILQETWKIDGTDYEMDTGRGKATIRIIEESGKIDINMLNDASGIILKNLLLLRGVAEGEADTIVDSLLDWRDSSDSDAHRMHGAESDYYATLPVPYAAKNANFDTVEELLLVKGMTADILFGNRERKGIAHLLTVHAHTDKININAAPRDVLAALPGIGEELADTIVSERQNRSTALTPADLQTLLGPAYASSTPYIVATESSTFTVESSGFREREQAAYRIRATVNFSQDFGSHRYVYFKTPVVEAK